MDLARPSALEVPFDQSIVEPRVTTTLLTPCGSLRSVNAQLKTVTAQLDESKAKEKLLEELKVSGDFIECAPPRKSRTNISDLY
ncbi:unnamed protein product [Echinostoma caproni]|uniref:Uncharacterized protein n=1 Tax=Echinostoma caproni TaxID=27848 RepID=A0A183B0X6_9TREM|nr:unnamed protein product [Echinostoma caproni]